MNSFGGIHRDGLDLPEPPADAIALSSRLIERIRQAMVRADGSIDFETYMRMALYEPGLGYYSGTASPFGAGGDFVTAPEISALFGHCLARQFGDLLQQGCAAQVLEFGAGSGKLCAHILTALPALQRYLILDLGALLKVRQQQTLQQLLSPQLFDKIEWLQQLPADFDGIVIANEVLDAMPVQLVRRQPDWRALGVSFDGNRLCWKTLPPGVAVVDALARIESRLGALPDRYCTEINLNYRPWFKALAQSCRQAVVLIIDYGYEQAEYYHVERLHGTLTCHYQHRVHADPLVYPGLQDITSFVDFDACADAAESSGFEPCGLVSQAEFLLANGLLEIAREQAEPGDNLSGLALSQEVKTLTLPQEMGEKFKVLAVQKNLALQMPAMRRGGLRG